MSAWRYLTDCFGVKHWKFYNSVSRPEATGTNMIGPCVKPVGGFSFKALALPAIAGLPLLLPPGDEFGAPAFVNLPSVIAPIDNPYNGYYPPINFGGIGNIFVPDNYNPVISGSTIPTVLNFPLVTSIENQLPSDIINVTNTPPINIPPVIIVPPLSPPFTETPEPNSLAILLIAFITMFVFKFWKSQR